MSDIRAIDSIAIGGRHRRDMGDIASLAASIAQLGLLHPVVVNQKGELIAGERRHASLPNGPSLWEFRPPGNWPNPLTIAVMNHGDGASLGQGHVHGIEHELRLQVVAHGPADNAA